MKILNFILFFVIFSYLIHITLQYEGENENNLNNNNDIKNEFFEAEEQNQEDKIIENNNQNDQVHSNTIKFETTEKKKEGKENQKQAKSQAEKDFNERFIKQKNKPQTFKPITETESLIKNIVGVDFLTKPDSDQTYWGIQLITDPLPETRERISEIEGERITLFNEEGIPFKCTIPNENKKNEDPEETKKKDAPHIPILLAPLESQCFYRWVGWWVYEFCPGRHLKQYHQDTVIDIKTQKTVVKPGTLIEYYLGFRGDGKIRAFSNKEEHHTLHFHDKVYDTPGKMTEDYYSELYTDGTVCDLTGQPRTTEVRYYCDPISGHQIVDIKEGSTCSYILTMNSPLLCKHPDYSPIQPDSYTIYCLSEQHSSNNNRNNIEFILKEEEKLIREISLDEKDFEDMNQNEGEEEDEEEK